ncbi:hypothetical protein ACFLU1_06455 [Chloroflexota bacterium]
MVRKANNIPQNALFVRSSGKIGQSLFHFFIVNFAEKDIESIRRNYKRYLSYVNNVKDDRLLVIVSFLSLEDTLSTLLRSYIPKYEKLGLRTFSQMVNQVRALKLIPSYLLDAASIINVIRNDFAHDIEIDNFDSLKSNHKQELTRLFRYLNPQDNVRNTPISHRFSTLVENLLNIFGVYASNLSVAREYIYSKDFREKMKEIAKSNYPRTTAKL